MRPDDFFVDDEIPGPFGIVGRSLNRPLITNLRSGPITDHTDVEVGVALARLVHDELELYGTNGHEQLNDGEMRDVLRALEAVVGRLGLTVDIPFRDFSTFRNYWLREGASGSWQARRNLLAAIFDGLHDQLADLEEQSLASTLADPISPHQRTGWSAVDTEIGEMRRHFQTAQTGQDYRNIGNDAVAVLEALSRTVYDPEIHLREGEEEPPVDRTKQRLERYVEVAAASPDDAKLRALVRAAIEFAQAVKHGTTPSRREAGIAADTVILLANLLRRLDQGE